jgi:hypothetical protein
MFGVIWAEKAFRHGELVSKMGCLTFFSIAPGRAGLLRPGHRQPASCCTPTVPAAWDQP